MQLPSNNKRDEVATSIRSCLISRQGDVTIKMLEKDYEEFEGVPIPYKEFNCPSLLVFLNQLRNTFLSIEKKDGRIVLRPVNTEKSKHISELVENQRSNQPNKRRVQKPYLGFCAKKAQVSLNSSILMELIRIIYHSPHGLPIDFAINFVNQYLRPLEITRGELEHQLKAISHKVVIYGNNLYPVNRIPIFPQPNFQNYFAHVNQVSQLNRNYYFQHSNMNPQIMQKRNSFVEPIKKSNSVNPVNELHLLVKKTDNTHEPGRKMKFSPAGCSQPKRTESNKGVIDLQNKEKTLKNGYKDQQNSPTNVKEPCLQKSECTTRKPCLQKSECITSKLHVNNDNKNHKSENLVESGLKEDSSNLTKITEIQLSKLIHQFPNGIWCSDLPQIYLNEYKTPLIYSKLEFSSTLDVVSHLPKIFHCVKPVNAEDYKLFNAKCPLPNLKIEQGPTGHPKVFPNRLNFNQSNSLMPKDVMEIGESVLHLSVTEFGRGNGYEEIDVSKVISPSFFWIQLRKNFTSFKKLVYDLNTFYKNNNSRYKVPLVLLQKGLNVACFFDDKWNRGIVKAVLPDSQTTIFFYDYGIEKKFFPDDIYFLHRSFSYFAAQAILCGLYNVKPYQTSNWSKDIVWEFISKTSCPLVGTVQDIDLEENLLLVNLTDTRTDEDLHINDWMYNEKFGEPGQITLKNRNFAFWYYKESLEQKGYNPSSIHYIHSEGLKSSKQEVQETDFVEIPPRESDLEKSKLCPLRLKKLLTSIAKMESNQEAEGSENCLPPLKEITSISEKKSTVERIAESTDEGTENPKYAKLLSLFKLKNSKNSHSNEIDDKLDYNDQDCLPPLKEITSTSEKKTTAESTENSNNAKLLLLLKTKNFNSSHCNGINDKLDYNDQNKPTTSKTVDSTFITDISNNDSTLKRSPFSLRQSTEGKTEMPYFGTIDSECGGNGRMEPIDWMKLRSAIVQKNNQEHRPQHVRDEISVEPVKKLEGKVHKEEEVIVSEHKEKLKNLPPKILRLLELQNKLKP